MNRSIFRVNILVLTLFLIFALFSGLPGQLIGIDRILLVTLVRNILFLLCPVVIFIMLTRLNIKESLSIRSLNIKSILLVIAFAFTIQPFTMFLSLLSNLFFTNELNGFLQTLVQKPTWYLLLTIAVIPAIFEEIPTRGLFLSQYKKVDIKIAALLNGLFFGAIHLNFQQFVYAFALGFLFAYLVRLTGSIFASMLAHFILNGSQVLLLKLQSTMGNADMFEAAMELSDQMVIMQFISIGFLTLVFTPIAILCMYGLGKVNGTIGLLSFKRKDSLEEKPRLDSLTMLPFYVLLGVFVILAAYIQFSGVLTGA